MAKNERLVRKRRGARRRSRLKLLLQLVASLVFVGVAALLSAGIVHVVERPKAPWPVEERPVDEEHERADAVAEPARVSLREGGSVMRETIEPVELAAPGDPRHAQLALRETFVEDLPSHR